MHAKKTSGDGSYSNLASFKAEVINSFVATHEITSVIEFGCGDGNQLRLAKYPSYIGIDVSQTAVAHCRKQFSQDTSKKFVQLSEYDDERAELGLSLDVIYHLVEDDVFEQHLRQVFSSAERFVIVYSSNTSTQAPVQGEHVRHRKFTEWTDANLKNWVLLQHLLNRYPFTGDESTSSLADFYIFQYKLNS